MLSESLTLRQWECDPMLALLSLESLDRYQRQLVCSCDAPMFFVITWDLQHRMSHIWKFLLHKLELASLQSYLPAYHGSWFLGKAPQLRNG